MKIVLSKKKIRIYFSLICNLREKMKQVSAKSFQLLYLLRVDYLKLMFKIRQHIFYDICLWHLFITFCLYVCDIVKVCNEELCTFWQKMYTYIFLPYLTDSLNHNVQLWCLLIVDRFIYGVLDTPPPL